MSVTHPRPLEEDVGAPKLFSLQALRPILWINSVGIQENLFFFFKLLINCRVKWSITKIIKDNVLGGSSIGGGLKMLTLDILDLCYHTFSTLQ